MPDDAPYNPAPEDRPHGWRDAGPLIGLIGYARSGKDSAAATLVNELGYQRVSFADPLRAAAYALDPIITTSGRRLASIVDTIGWERAKDKHPEVRRILQNYGQGLRKTVNENIWRDIALTKVDWHDGPVVITDVRYPNEVKAIARRGGVLVRVERPGFGPVNGHDSETGIDGLAADTVLRNDGDMVLLASRIRLIHETIAAHTPAQFMLPAA